MRNVGKIAFFALLVAGCAKFTAVEPDAGGTGDAGQDSGPYEPTVEAGTTLAGYNVSTLAGTGVCGNDDSDRGTTATLCRPIAIAVGPDDSVYVTEDGDLSNPMVYNSKIRKIDPVKTTVTTFASFSGGGAQNGPCASETLYSLAGIVVDSSDIYVVEGYIGLRRIAITSTPCQVTTLLLKSDNSSFVGVTLDASSGNLYLADGGNNVILRRESGGNTTVIAGTIPPPGQSNSGLVNGPALSAQFGGLSGIAVDAAGNIYVTETDNSDIRKIAVDGQVTTLAGSGTPGTLNDGLGTSATFNSPGGLAIDIDGSLIVSDTYNHAIRRISAAGEVTTIAGMCNKDTNKGIPGDADGPTSVAAFSYPAGVAVRPSWCDLCGRPYQQQGS